MTHDDTTGGVIEQPRHVYLYLLLSQVAFTVLYPKIGDLVKLTILLEMFLLVALVGGVLPSIADRRRLLVTTTLAVLFLLARWSGLLLSIDELILLSAMFAVVFFGYVAVVLIRHIFLAASQQNAHSGLLSIPRLVPV